MYKKVDVARFIGHLDLQSFFNKAFKRANLPVAYSQGFNPHQLLSIALPLSMGMAGHEEIVEIFLAKEMEVKEIIDNLNDQMPAGMEILDAVLVSNSGKSAAGLVSGAAYRLIFPMPLGEAALESLKTADFADKIISAVIEEGVIITTLCAGSAKNLKLQVFAQYIIEQLGLDFSPIDIKYERTRILL